MKQIYIILMVLLFNSCTTSEEEECVPKFKGGDKVTFIADPTIIGIVICGGAWCDIYQVSYFDKHGINHIDEFNVVEIK